MSSRVVVGGWRLQTLREEFEGLVVWVLDLEGWSDCSTYLAAQGASPPLRCCTHKSDVSSQETQLS